MNNSGSISPDEVRALWGNPNPHSVIIRNGRDSVTKEDLRGLASGVDTDGEGYPLADQWQVLADQLNSNTGRGRYLTEKEARACLKIVNEWIEKKAGPGWEPALYPPGHEGDYWNVSLEGAMDDWPWMLSTDESVTWPEGVWVEAGASWYLALHRAD